MKPKVINFTKMCGAGNDFIVIEALRGIDYRKLAIAVCNRTSGIGADGLLILDKSTVDDYKMRIINSDGSEAEMCGNGVRCIADYIVKNRSVHKKIFSIETKAGSILAEVKDKVVHVRLNDPIDYQADIDILINGRKIQINYIDTGVPHTIVYVSQLKDINVPAIGRLIRYHQRFYPRGTNVNFVEQLDKNLIGIRTYERGVENETRACGTGSVAAGIVTYLKANPKFKDTKKANMKVLTQSKEILDITFDIEKGKVINVWLKGSANFIAKGEYYV